MQNKVLVVAEPVIRYQLTLPRLCSRGAFLGIIETTLVLGMEALPPSPARSGEAPAKEEEEEEEEQEAHKS